MLVCLKENLKDMIISILLSGILIFCFLLYNDPDPSYWSLDWYTIVFLFSFFIIYSCLIYIVIEFLRNIKNMNRRKKIFWLIISIICLILISLPTYAFVVCIIILDWGSIQSQAFAFPAEIFGLAFCIFLTSTIFLLKSIIKEREN